MAENHKIRNATPLIFNNIKFRSKLEVAIYKYLLSIEITPEYEKEKICIWNKDRFDVPYYDRYGKVFSKITRKPTSVHYTPDFTFYYNDIKVFLEVKGYKNDVTPYKLRLFRDYLERLKNESNQKVWFAVVHSVKDLKIFLRDLQTAS